MLLMNKFIDWLVNFLTDNHYDDLKMEKQVYINMHRRQGEEIYRLQLHVKELQHRLSVVNAEKAALEELFNISKKVH